MMKVKCFHNTFVDLLAEEMTKWFNSNPHIEYVDLIVLSETLYLLIYKDDS